MPPDIELRYIHIKWNDDKTVKSIEESLISPRAEVTGDVHHFDLYAYTRDGKVEKLLQPALFIENATELTPYISQIDGGKVPLREVFDPESRKTWWIEDGKWMQYASKAAGQTWSGFESQWLNSAGEVDVVIENIQCHLTIRSIAIEDWQIIYDEFKNELYHLIFKEGSSVRAAVAKSGASLFDERIVDLLGKYLKHLGKILRKPQKRLRDIQSKKSLSKLKPVTKTFMEFSINPTLKKYTGKDTTESLDTADNRYIHYTLQFVGRIVRGMQKSQLVAQHLWKQKRDNTLRQLEGLSDHIQVDEALFLKELKTYEEEYEVLTTRIEKAIASQTGRNLQRNLQDLDIDVWYEYNPNRKGWACGVAMDGVKRIFDDGKNFTFFNFEQCFHEFIRQGEQYKICAHTEKKRTDKEPDMIWNIKTLTPLGLKNKLDALRKHKAMFEQNGWWHPLDSQQKNEQRRHKNMLQENDKQYEGALQKLKTVQAPLSTHQPRLQTMLRAFSNVCGLEPSFPASMAFIQNPDYSGAHLRYSELRNLTGLDDSTLNALEYLEHIGVIDIPTVYERWCLLQVIKVITEVFGFTSAEGWEQRLVEQMVGGIKAGGHKNVRDIKLEFEHESTGWKLEVWYEKPLQNMKRPDITLNLFTKNSKGRFDPHTLVLDAKYYEHWDSITGALENLYLVKDYSISDKNHVFVLHPYNKDMPDRIRITPQEWGKHNFYGERQMFSWEEDKIGRRENELYQRYGFIMASPLTAHGNNTDNIQRVIGMFLQYPFYCTYGKEEIESETYFCISCGANSYSFDKSSTQKGNPMYYITCLKCGHKAQLTHCFSQGCGTTIFKNGPYWSYHKAELLEPFNISCPDCGSRF